MLNAREVFARIKKLAAFKDMQESDFRVVVYNQNFTPASGGVPTAFSPQVFPGGAIVLGITAAGCTPNVAPPTGNVRQCFQVDFSYTGGETLVIGGPGAADAILGGGDTNIFPLKELVIAPNQQILARVANLTNVALTVSIAYHCLVYRFAT
jgi:hypothetical protein